MYILKAYINYLFKKNFKTNYCLKEADLVGKEDPFLRIVVL